MSERHLGTLVQELDRVFSQRPRSGGLQLQNDALNMESDARRRHRHFTRMNLARAFARSAGTPLHAFVASSRHHHCGRPNRGTPLSQLHKARCRSSISLRRPRDPATSCGGRAQPARRPCHRQLHPHASPHEGRHWRTRRHLRRPSCRAGHRTPSHCLPQRTAARRSTTPTKNWGTDCGHLDGRKLTLGRACAPAREPRQRRHHLLRPSMAATARV